MLCESEPNVMNSISLLTPVALTEDIPDQQADMRGQIGTIVEYLDHDGEQALLVEFSDEHGETYTPASRFEAIS